MLFVDTLARMSGDPLGQVPDGVLGQARHLMALHRGLSEAFDPDLARTIRTDLDDLVILEPGPDRIKGAVNEDRQTSRQRVHA